MKPFCAHETIYNAVGLRTNKTLQHVFNFGKGIEKSGFGFCDVLCDVSTPCTAYYDLFSAVTPLYPTEDLTR